MKDDIRQEESIALCSALINSHLSHSTKNICIFISISVCICICVCIYVCICICVCIYVCICICISICIFVLFMSVFVFVSVSIFVPVFVFFVCIIICMWNSSGRHSLILICQIQPKNLPYESHPATFIHFPCPSSSIFSVSFVSDEIKQR